MNQEEILHCKNCKQSIQHNYCSICGYPATLKRIDRRYVIDEIAEVLHFEKGIFYTIRELMIRPGENIRRFIAEERGRLVKPIFFLIVTSLIYTVINHYFKIDESYIASSKELKGSKIVEILTWLSDNYGYTNLMMSVFIAFWVRRFFRKYGYNYFEILVMLFFLLGVTMLISSLFGMIQGLTGANMMWISGLVTTIYIVWGIGQFFHEKKWRSYWKAFVAFIIGFLIFEVSIVVIGFSLDVINK